MNRNSHRVRTSLITLRKLKSPFGIPNSLGDFILYPNGTYYINIVIYQTLVLRHKIKEIKKLGLIWQ